MASLPRRAQLGRLEPPQDVAKAYHFAVRMAVRSGHVMIHPIAGAACEDVHYAGIAPAAMRRPKAAPA